MSNSLQTHGLYSPWNSPGQNTGVGSLYLLQGFFPTQGSNPSLPHYRQILYQLSHKESPLSHRLSGLKQHTSVLSSEIQNGSHWVKSSLPLGEPNRGYRRRQWHPIPVLLLGKDGGAWWAAVHGVGKGWTRLSDFTLTFHSHALEKEMATHSSVLAWRIPGTGCLVGCRLWGRTGSDTTEVT